MITFLKLLMAASTVVFCKLSATHQHDYLRIFRMCLEYILEQCFGFVCLSCTQVSSHQCCDRLQSVSGSSYARLRAPRCSVPSCSVLQKQSSDLISNSMVVPDGLDGIGSCQRACPVLPRKSDLSECPQARRCCEGSLSPYQSRHPQLAQSCLAAAKSNILKCNSQIPRRRFCRTGILAVSEFRLAIPFIGLRH